MQSLTSPERNVPFRFSFPFPITGSVVEAVPARVPGSFPVAGWINIRNILFNRAAISHLRRTVQLLARARAGDRRALDEVFARAIPLLKRWASGRLPRWAREMIDTDDLVQETVVNTLKHIDVFEYRVDSALQESTRY